MSDTLHGAEARAKLIELVKDIRVAFFTTLGAEGQFQSRPMYAQQTAENGDIWFAISRDASLVADLRADPRSSVCFADPGDDRFIAVRGLGTVLHDQAKIHELWNPTLKLWFPGGESDVNLMLVRVTPETAEFWDSPSAPVRWLQFAKAIVTGKQPVGESVTLELNPAS